MAVMDNEPRIEVVQMPSLFGEAMADAQAKLEAERAHLTSQQRDLLAKLDAEMDEAAFKHFVLGQ